MSLDIMEVLILPVCTCGQEVDTPSKIISRESQVQAYSFCIGPSECEMVVPLEAPPLGCNKTIQFGLGFFY